MALCLDCGNSIGNALKCARCGSIRLRGLDPVVSGTSQNGTDNSARVEETIDQLLINPAPATSGPPSAASLREVKRQGRRRRLARLFRRR